MDLGILTLDILVLHIAHLMFLPLNLHLEIQIEHVAIGLFHFMSNLYSQLECFTGKLQAMQLIVLAVFGAVD